MPLFQIDGATLSQTRPTNFNQEKEIQVLIEKNLETVFNCRFIASEFSTGSEHGLTHRVVETRMSSPAQWPSIGF